jgi:hypothetical protein
MRRMSGLLLAFAANAAWAGTDGFDQQSAPEGWLCGVTGRGASKWAVEADSSAPSKPNVLRQSGRGTFPWCAKQGVSVTDGFVEVRFKPEQGREDQAGGVVWRFKDADNYYIARGNALENNVSLYYTTRGTRHTIKYVDAPVAANQWHTLRVEYQGAQIKVLLDGKQYIQEEDKHISGPGAVGIWTKADSVTAFDDFAWGGP